jgi:hypothetical protein
MPEWSSVSSLDELLRRWKSGIKQYERQIAEAKRNGTPFDSMQGERWQLIECQKNLETVLRLRRSLAYRLVTSLRKWKRGIVVKIQSVVRRKSGACGVGTAAGLFVAGAGRTSTDVNQVTRKKIVETGNITKGLE